MKLTAESLRAHAAESGIDLDALIDSASRHFSSPVIVRRTAPTDAEIAAAAESEKCERY